MAVLAPRVFLSLREAIHATATSYRHGMKSLAAELDYSPSNLAHRTTISGDSAQPFPADDDHFVRLMRVTGDYSILATLADLLGFELQPKRERLGELMIQTQELLKTAQTQMKQLQLELDGQGKRR